MELQNLRKQISEAGFSEDAKALLLTTLDQAIARGSLSEKEKQKMLDIVNFEIDKNNLEAEVEGEIALALDSYIAEVSDAFQTAQDSIEGADMENESAPADASLAQPVDK